MSIRSSLSAAGLAWLLVGGICLSAMAEDKEQAKQEPKKEEPKCVTNQTGFKQVGDKPVFEVTLENSCDMRIKCTVDIYVLGAKGPTQGHTTMVLGPAAKGQSTRKVYALKVKSAGGMANMSQECKKI